MHHHTLFYIGSVICCHLEQDQAVCEVSVTEKQEDSTASKQFIKPAEIGCKQKSVRVEV